MTNARDSKKRFMDDGYLIFRDIIPVELIDEIVDFSNKNKKQYIVEEDRMFKQEIICFNEPYQLKLQTQNGINNPYAKMHSFLLDFMQENLGMRLIPTYHFGRIHLNDSKGMIWHTDRVPCEVSVTLPIAYSGPPWPIWLQANNGKQKVDLKVGDILLYRGCEIPHHREPYGEEYAFNHYFHFVDAESEVGSLFNYYDPLEHGEWEADMNVLVQKNRLPELTEKVIASYKERNL